MDDNYISPEYLEKQVKELLEEGSKIIDPQLQSYFNDSIAGALFGLRRQEPLGHAVVLKDIAKARGIITYSRINDLYFFPNASKDGNIVAVAIWIFLWVTLGLYWFSFPQGFYLKPLLGCFLGGLAGGLFRLLRYIIIGVSNSLADGPKVFLFIFKGGITGLAVYFFIKSGLILLTNSSEIIREEFLYALAFLAGYSELFFDRMLKNIQEKMVFYQSSEAERSGAPQISRPVATGNPPQLP